jgi:hypothetical protein
VLRGGLGDESTREHLAEGRVVEPPRGSSSGDSRRRSRRESSIVAGYSMCTNKPLGAAIGQPDNRSESRPHRVG